MAKHRLTNDEIAAQFVRAKLRTRRAQATEPHALTARYDRRLRAVDVKLTNGSSFRIPTANLPELSEADDEALAAVEVSPGGAGIHWESLDVDLSVAGLVRNMFGARAVSRAAGAIAGAMRSEAKADAARRNGSKGGRPRKQLVDA